MNRVVFIVALVLGALVGCASPPGGGSTSPEQAVFAAKSNYAVALNVAVAYRRLPACASPAVLPCHDPQVLAQLRKADIVANGALDAAESAVRSPAIGKDAASRAVAAANAALAALTAITSTIKLEAKK